MRLYVDTWDPSYTAAMGTLRPTSVEVDPDVELPASQWRTLDARAGLALPDVVHFVDGVRRIDGRVWAEESDGTAVPGLAASYAAGVVRCDLRQGRAEMKAHRLERTVFSRSPIPDLHTAIVRYQVRRPKSDDPVKLEAAVLARLRELEQKVSVAAGDDAELLIVDGPLHDELTGERTLGFVKTHDTQYLSGELDRVVGRLASGQRSPVFGLNGSRHSWYLKLPNSGRAPWSGVVRLETHARSASIRLADLSTALLPRFASHPFKDARAPQNLVPIGGLERRLRAMLGDPRLMLRALTTAAAAI